MAFTTKEFPHHTFENIKEYENYLSLRKTIAEKLKLASRDKRTRVLKVLSIIKKDDPILNQLIQWILKFLKTSS